VFTHIRTCLLADSLFEPLTLGASVAAVASDLRPNCFRRSESCRVGVSLPWESCSVSTAHCEMQARNVSDTANGQD